MSSPLVSVIVGFKDWGLERLTASMASIHESLGDHPHEIIISDFGSEDAEGVRQQVEAAGGRVARTETDGTWSRSRALNAGFAAARGEVILATDADMLFSPKALQRVVERLQEHPNETVLIQCRDLPVGMGPDQVREVHGDWKFLEQVASLRPRWGMGGLVGIHSEWIRLLRGWDERMHTYGGEDVDFARRAQRMGLRQMWLEHPEVRMYHIWHPSSSLAASKSEAAQQAIAFNRSINKSDHTYTRNREESHYLPVDMGPTVLIVVVPHADATVAVLESAINSYLAQDLQTVQVLVLGASDAMRDRFEGTTGVVCTTEAVVPVHLRRVPFVAFSDGRSVWSGQRLSHLLAEHTAKTGIMSDGSDLLLVPSDPEQVLSAPAERGRAMPGFSNVVVRSALLDPFGWDFSDSRQLFLYLATSGSGFVVLPSTYNVFPIPEDHEELFTREHHDESTWLAQSMTAAGLDEVMKDWGAAIPTSLDAMATALLRRSPVVLTFEGGSREGAARCRDKAEALGGEVSTRQVLTADGLLVKQFFTAAFPLASSAFEFMRTAAAEGLRTTVGEASAPGDFGQYILEVVEHYESLHGDDRRMPWLGLIGADPTVAEDELLQLPGVTTVVARVLEMDQRTQHVALARMPGAAMQDVLRAAAEAQRDLHYYIPSEVAQ